MDRAFSVDRLEGHVSSPDFGRAAMTDVTLLIFGSAGAGLAVGLVLGFMLGWGWR